MASELKFPSDKQVAAACEAAGGDAAVAVQRLTRAHLPDSNATKATRQEWVDGVTSRVNSCLEKAAADAAKPEAPSKAITNATKQPKQQPPDGGSKPDNAPTA